MFMPIKLPPTPKSIKTENQGIFKVRNKKQTVSKMIDDFLKEKDQFSNVVVTIDRSSVTVDFWFPDSEEPWVWEEFMPNSKMQKASKDLTENIKKVLS